MSTKLYVGNLAFQTTSQELQELFATAGKSCKNCLQRPARLNQRASWKIATPDGHGASPSSKCPPRKRQLQPLINSMAKSWAAAPLRSTKPSRVRIAASAVVALAAIAAATAVIAVVAEAAMAPNANQDGK